MKHSDICKGTVGIIGPAVRGKSKWWDADELAAIITKRGFPIDGHRLAIFLAKEGVQKKGVYVTRNNCDHDFILKRSGSKWLLCLSPEVVR